MCSWSTYGQWCIAQNKCRWLRHSFWAEGSQWSTAWWTLRYVQEFHLFFCSQLLFWTDMLLLFGASGTAGIKSGLACFLGNKVLTFVVELPQYGLNRCKIPSLFVNQHVYTSFWPLAVLLEERSFNGLRWGFLYIWWYFACDRQLLPHPRKETAWIFLCI